MVTVNDSANSSPRPARTVFTERLFVPPWWWAFFLLAVAIVVGQGIYMHSPWWVWLLLVLLGPLIAWLLVRAGSEKIYITDDGEGHRSLVAGGAVLPLENIARCAVVPATAKSAAMGRQLDPEAYVVHRGYIKTMAIIVLDDPEDPTPYWLVSCRKAEELTDLLPGKARS